MTLDEAIFLLQRDIDNPGSVPIEQLTEAEGLGIEALKREQEKRLTAPNWPWRLLPGETKE